MLAPRMGWFQAVVLLSVPRWVSTMCEVAGEEPNPEGMGLVDESTAVRLGEWNGIDAGERGLPAREGIVASPRLDSALESGPVEKADELAPGILEAGGDVMDPEGNISMPR